ncbi:MAG: nitroreductase family protein, partial [Gemmatimonadota bacterium]|nr:nitroreductase family protein [Gemmatimonadota bacterium]
MPLGSFVQRSRPEMLQRAREFRRDLARRRTVRDFSSRQVPLEVI